MVILDWSASMLFPDFFKLSDIPVVTLCGKTQNIQTNRAANSRALNTNDPLHTSSRHNSYFSFKSHAITLTF
jgi:hypothetical protein